MTSINFGDFRRVTPLSRDFGYGRGRPVDRYYIEHFLSGHAGDVRGRLLEIGDDRYTRHFGGAQVTHSDVLDLPRADNRPTIEADLADAGHLAGEQFDCIIFTQTLQYIYRVEAAIATLYRLLRPGGVLLGSFPVISQICRFDMDRWGDYWRFTEASVRRLLSGPFVADRVTVRAEGNVLTALCFLHGLAAEDLTPGELTYRDPDYQLVVLARAVKSSAEATRAARALPTATEEEGG